VVLALAAGWADYALVPAAETPAQPIAGMRPDYVPGAVAAVPNAAAVTKRMWMPGLDDGYDAQGLALADDTILVSAYRSDELSVHRGPCRVFRIDAETGAEIGHVDVPSPCGHAGGLATGGDGNLYVADTHTLFVTPLATSGPFRKIALGPGIVGGLAMSATDGIWIGTYNESGPGRLYHFAAATLAALKDGDTLRAEQAAAAIQIPDYAQGAATGAGALWVARSDTRWGTLDRLDPATGKLARRYDVAPGTEGIAFDAAGRLWAVSEAGARHFYDHPFLSLYIPFYPLVFALDPARLR
jgi:outer membrane protein assembly factor BamB